jgi:hypothetical protein
LVVDDFADADLGDFDAACQAGAGVAVEDCILANAIAAGFEESVFFGVQAEAGGEAGAAFCGAVAARTWGVSATVPNSVIHVSLQPPSLQFVMPRGVPLYPVLITRFSRTIQQPTRLFIQLHLCAARSANCMKYWSQLGRRRASLVRFRDRSAWRKASIEGVELSSLSCARWKSALRPVP